jgi:hypothetical protein
MMILKSRKFCVGRFAILTAILVTGPLLMISNSYATSQKDDEKKIDKLQKTKDEPQKKYDTDSARLNKLKNTKTVADLDGLAIKGDCFTNCAPSSAGGKCPDILFTDGAITAGAAVSVTDKKFSITDPNQIKADLAATYPAVTTQKGASLCEAVKPQLDKYAYYGGLQGCQDAVNSCRWVATDKERAELEVTVQADKEALDAINKQITSIQNREDDMANTDCADCQASYYGTGGGAGSMTKLQGAALLMNALTGPIEAGLSAATAIHGQSEYANEYNTYCGTGLTTGIPCNAPSALTGTYGGGLSTTVYGGYGSAMGGGGYGTALRGGSLYGGYGTALGGGSLYGGYGTALGGSMYGSYGTALGGSSTYGGYGTALGGGSLYGGYGTALGGGSLYGGYGTALGGGSLYGGYGTGTSSSYNPYSGYTSSNQNSALYSESLSQQMLSAQRAAQSQQDLMLSQQQIYQAESRYSETAAQAYGSNYSSLGTTGYGEYGTTGYGTNAYGGYGSYSGYGGTSTGYNGYLGGAPTTSGGSAL